MRHRRVISKVSRWLREQGYRTRREIRFCADLPNERHIPIFRVDIVAEKGAEVVGVECKGTSEVRKFSDLCTGIGQAYVLQRRFGRSYLALSVDNKTANKVYRLGKNIIHNVSNEVGFGVLLVGKRMILQEPIQPSEPIAETLFAEHKRTKQTGEASTLRCS